MVLCFLHCSLLLNRSLLSPRVPLPLELSRQGRSLAERWLTEPHPDNLYRSRSRSSTQGAPPSLALLPILV